MRRRRRKCIFPRQTQRVKRYREKGERAQASADLSIIRGRRWELRLSDKRVSQRENPSLPDATARLRVPIRPPRGTAEQNAKRSMIELMTDDAKEGNPHVDVYSPATRLPLHSPWSPQRTKTGRGGRDRSLCSLFFLPVPPLREGRGKSVHLKLQHTHIKNTHLPTAWEKSPPHRYSFYRVSRNDRLKVVAH